MVLAALHPLSPQAQGIADIVKGLQSVACFDADVRFAVSLPQNENDVVYDVSLRSTDPGADTLFPFDYLTRWVLEGVSSGDGFAAYFSGHHYRYGNKRLQEYHTEWDSVPFRPGGRNVGVQATARFTDLYPASLAKALEEMAADSTYTFSVAATPAAVEVKAVQRIGGDIATERRMRFSPATYLPVSIYTESNPGQLTEQSITVSYSYPDGQTDMPCPEINEAKLMAMFPDAFANCREVNFSIENLAGRDLPQFSLPTATGERYTYHQGDGFATPTLIVVMEPDGGFNRDLVALAREAADRATRDLGILWVMASSNPDTAEQTVGPLRVGEHLLINGKSLARDCGVASYPVCILASPTGKVKKTVLGFNKELPSIVIQEIALIND